MLRIRSPPIVGLVRVTDTDAYHASVQGPRVPRIRSLPTVALIWVTDTDAYHAGD